jgi:Spy/CpxP family protein refolding chaperone
MARLNSKWPVAGILGGLVILAAGIVPTEAHRRDRAPITELGERLGLSEEQRQALREIYARQGESRRQIVRGLREARRSLRELIVAGGDEAQIQARTAEVQALVGQALELGVRTLREVTQVLTPEQRETLRSLRPGQRLGELLRAG